MSKEKEEGKEKEKIMETSTIPSSEVITSIKEQLEAIGFNLSFDNYYKIYSVTIDFSYFVKRYYIPELIKILESPYANFVTKLDLKNLHIRDSIKNFVKQLKDTHVTTLNLTDNHLGNEGAIALAETIKYSNVTVLNLRNTKIGNEGAEALANALKEEGNKITQLGLMDNNLKDEGAKTIAKAIKRSNVTELYLQYNSITMEGALALADELKDSKVTGLYLMKNSIGDEGAKAIAKAIKNGWEPTVLDLASNNIGDEGAKAIAKAIKGSSITTLNLAGNRIGNEGAKVLVEAIKGSKVTTLFLSSNNIENEVAETLVEEGLKGIVHTGYQKPPLTSSTSSTTTTSVSTTSSFDNSRSTKKKEGKEKEKMKEAIIAGAINTPELSSFDKIYGNLVKEPGKSLTPEEVTKLGDQYLTSDRILNLFSKNPKKAYEELITAHKFDTGMFIKLVVYQQVCSIGKFAFEHHKYLLDSVKNGTFNLGDPMLLAYAVRLSNEELALSVTKELVRKGAVIADNILFHSYNNPHVTKFLLREKPSIITCQDKLMGTDAVIKKVQGKLFTSASETDKVKFKTTLELLKAAKTGGDDLNIKLDIICPLFLITNIVKLYLKFILKIIRIINGFSIILYRLKNTTRG
jgi:membrane protease subunit (stomatin/prohibitin family)